MKNSTKTKLIVIISLIPFFCMVFSILTDVFLNISYIPVKATIVNVDTMATGSGCDGCRGIELKFTYTTRSGKTYTETDFYNYDSFKTLPHKGQVMDAGYMPLFNSRCMILTDYQLSKKRKQ